MVLYALNQNITNFNSFMTFAPDTKFGNQNNGSNNSNSYYAKKGEPAYQEEMDSDNDGIVTFDEFKDYCNKNGISAKEMTKMLENRMVYQKLQNSEQDSENKRLFDPSELSIGSLDLIYAKDGDKNYNSEIDINKDSQVSYIEYLRYCEQNARQEAKNSDTKVIDDNKNKFMTRSFGHISNAYNRVQTVTPEGKVEGKA